LQNFGFHRHWICAALLISGPLCASEFIPKADIDHVLEAQRAPDAGGLIGLPSTLYQGRAAYLHLITREAERVGLPADVADAVAHVESRFNPTAVGGVGEVGLMQIRPQTAAMLGYSDGVTGLFDPEINVRYGVRYLVRAWQLANGNLCRALMKYRAGHGEERISPMSVEYCRRARQHLAAIGSPLAGGTTLEHVRATSFAERVSNPVESNSAGGQPRQGDGHGQVRASQRVGAGAWTEYYPAPVDAYARELRLAQAQARSRRGTRTEADSQRFWAAREARVRRIQGRLQAAAQTRPGIRL
jgi:Transglycosylase SLT domain